MNEQEFAELFFAWWYEHRNDGAWVPGQPPQYGHVERAFRAGFKAGLAEEAA